MALLGLRGAVLEGWGTKTFSHEAVEFWLTETFSEPEIRRQGLREWGLRGMGAPSFYYIMAKSGEL